MEKLSKAKTGLVLGLFFAVVHAVWAILVALGVAQGLLDWVFKMHMIENPYIISDFGFGTAVGPVIMTFVVGYIFGWVFAALWNSLRKSSQ
jgi:uncharacterized membrane protein